MSNPKGKKFTAAEKYFQGIIESLRKELKAEREARIRYQSDLFKSEQLVSVMENDIQLLKETNQKLIISPNDNSRLSLGQFYC